jgi:hypothetical protein
MLCHPIVNMFVTFDLEQASAHLLEGPEYKGQKNHAQECLRSGAFNLRMLFFFPNQVRLGHCVATLRVTVVTGGRGFRYQKVFRF